jgi:YHS domain-containing protein
MPKPTITTLAAVVVLIQIVQPAFAQADAKSKRNIKEWSLNKGLAIQGYDPVAYFPEGGGKPMKGQNSIKLTRDGVTYHFANEQHRALFKNNPDRYEPAYGGWCAWAMREGTKTEIDPQTFIVKDDRLLLFYNGFWGNTKKSWEKEGTHAGNIKLADTNWKKISGEAPRPVPPKTDQKDDGDGDNDKKRG